MEEKVSSPQPPDGGVDEDVDVDEEAASPVSVVAGNLNASRSCDFTVFRN